MHIHFRLQASATRMGLEALEVLLEDGVTAFSVRCSGEGAVDQVGFNALSYVVIYNLCGCIIYPILVLCIGTYIVSHCSAPLRCATPSSPVLFSALMCIAGLT